MREVSLIKDDLDNSAPINDSDSAEAVELPRGKIKKTIKAVKRVFGSKKPTPAPYEARPAPVDNAGKIIDFFLFNLFFSRNH